MKPSMVSSSGRSSAARSRYRCFCPGFGQTSKMTAIILKHLVERAVAFGRSLPKRRTGAAPTLSRRGGVGTPHFNRSGGSGHGPQERALLAQDKALLLGKAEIGGAFTIGLEPRAVDFVGGEAVERNQPIADVVGALMRHPIAEKISAALGNDGEPPPGVFFEGVALKRIELVADEDRDAHGSLLAVSWGRLPTSCRVAWRARFGYYRTMLACWACRGAGGQYDQGLAGAAGPATAR